MKQIYFLTLESLFSMSVEIDTDILTTESLKDINDFWVDSDWRLKSSKGNLLNAVLKMLVRTCFYLQGQSDCCAEDMIKEFNKGTLTEGWPPMDGSKGIKILEVSDIDIEDIDITISKY